MENREMQTSNTAEMVTISRAEYERFQEQAQVITSLTLQNDNEGAIDRRYLCVDNLGNAIYRNRL